MKHFSQTLVFDAPLRDVRLADRALLDQAGDSKNDNPAQWQSGYETGKIDGEKALSEQLMKQRSEMHELLNGVVQSLRGAVPQVIRDTESMVVSLALEIAQKMVGEMSVSVPMLESVVRDALSEVEGNAQMTIRLHAADLELLQSSKSPLLEVQEGANEVRFLASPDVTRGGCMVQTRFGTVDARRETKFDLLKRSLLS